MNSSSSRISKTVAFEAAALGYVTTRIPALVCTRAGTLLAFCEARRDWHDWAEIDTLMRRSLDGGKTWSDITVLWKGNGGPAGNPTPIAARDGTIHFHCQRAYERAFYFRSEDEGETWSDPRDITETYEAFRPEYDWQILAPGPVHGLEMRESGRLIVPIWLCNPATPKKPPGDHRPSCVATIYSDDSGNTWKRGEIVLNTCARFINPSETVAAQLSDGSVILNIRSESPEHRRIICTSPDGISNWSRPAFDDELYEPVCQGTQINSVDPTGRPVLIFCNPDSRARPEERWPDVRFCTRENGVVRLSYDDGNTWPVHRVLDPEMFAYSDIAVGPDHSIYCLYESGDRDTHGIGATKRIVLAKFSLDWLTNTSNESEPPDIFSNSKVH